jgi:tRNA-Thr(GGU) m(6)t(6)A37 methyltransferase TsaA
VVEAASGREPLRDPAGYAFRPIGILRSCYTDKFGVPRQPGLVTAAEARLELFPAFAREEAFKGIEGFSHVWLIFVFHECIADGWRPTVRPPRLGGRRKVGVFASRSPHRPNPIGISAVELLGLSPEETGLVLRLRGVDLLDGTPVLDVKPYVPYADAIPEAAAGFATQPPGREWAVEITPQAQVQIAAADPDGGLRLGLLLAQILRQDPRPGYMDRYPDRTEFGMRLYDLEIRWRLTGDGIQVTAVKPAED